MSSYRFSALAVLVVGWLFSCSDGDDPTFQGESLDASTSDASPSDASSSDASVPDAPDAAPSDASTSDASDAGCPVGAICGGTFNYAFVTSTDYAVTELGGVVGADAKCNERAQAAGLPGEYVAWISSSTSNARARLGTASGWLRTDRRPFAVSADDLFDAKIRYPLTVDETGTNVASSVRYVRTGTLADGTVSTDKHCADWALDSGGTIEMGDPFSGNHRWSTLNAGGCGGKTPIYCLGKDHSTPVPLEPVTGRRAFASSAHYAPNGLAQADAICASEAAGVLLTGTYKALLATTTASAISRFSTTGATWVRPDGVALWETAAQAAANAPLLAPPILHADQTRTAFAWRWLGATQIDAVGTATCADWASSGAAVKGLAVEGDAAGKFAEYAFNCDSAQIGLICLEE